MNTLRFALHSRQRGTLSLVSQPRRHSSAVADLAKYSKLRPSQISYFSTWNARRNLLTPPSSSASSLIISSTTSQVLFQNVRHASVFSKIKDKLGFGKKEEAPAPPKPEAPKHEAPKTTTPPPKATPSPKTTPAPKATPPPTATPPPKAPPSSAATSTPPASSTTEDQFEQGFKFMRVCVEKGKFDMNDLREHFKDSLLTGKTAKWLSYVPGFNRAASLMDTERQNETRAYMEKQMKIIDAMTPKERENPSSLLQRAGREKTRIAQQAGSNNAEVNNLLNSYVTMKLLFDKLVTRKKQGLPYPSTMAELTSIAQSTSGQMSSEHLNFLKMKNRSKFRR